MPHAPGSSSACASPACTSHRRRAGSGRAPARPDESLSNSPCHFARPGHLAETDRMGADAPSSSFIELLACALPFSPGFSPGPRHHFQPGSTPRGGGVGDSRRPQQVEIGLVLPPQFEVIQAALVAQHVVGQVQHVVRLLIRPIDLEQMQPLVDGLGEPEFADELLDQPDAAVGGPAGSGSLLSGRRPDGPAPGG
jgi:hypothetical protein